MYFIPLSVFWTTASMFMRYAQKQWRNAKTGERAVLVCAAICATHRQLTFTIWLVSQLSGSLAICIAYHWQCKLTLAGSFANVSYLVRYLSV